MKSEREYNIEIGKKIKYQRESNGISREELAKRLGYASKTSICKIENGAARIPVEKIFHFAKALGCDVSDLTVPVRDIEPDDEYISEVIKKNTVSGDSTEKLQHIMLILAQMTDEQINKAESILATIFENN